MFGKSKKTVCLILTAAMVMTSALLLHAENGISAAEESVEEPVKFTADNKNVSLNKKGILKAKKAGTVTVKGLDAEGNELQSIEFTIEAPKFKKAEKLKQSEISEGYTIEGYSLFEEGSGIQPDSWTSKKEKIATVDESTGLITLTGEKGGTVITAYFGEGKEAAKLKYKVKVIK